MFRPNWKLLLSGVIAVAMFGVVVPQANAFWGYPGACCYTPCYTSWCCSYATCYSPCYTPCYTTSCDPCCCDPCGGGWYVGLRRGPIRRCLVGPYRCYYGGCYGWSTCWSGTGCYDVCSEDVSVCDAASPAPAVQTPTPARQLTAEQPLSEPAPTLPAEPTPVLPTEPAPVLPSEPAPALPGFDSIPGALPGGAGDLPSIPALPDSSAVPKSANSGLLTVWVPYDAKVTINGLLTRSTGSRRRFVSHGLKRDYVYNYVVRAELVRDGRVVAESRTIKLTAGGREAVAFGFNTGASEALATR